ncbi:protein LURP-one-related 8-like [Zingiber officinale]|uniref:Protein LURP-one-related 8 n=1 Tax=Zingiber officinale TaxID=94328 RepID=A0A8J5M9D4_ZINOF|nr:protein LURP-one-related 8-like [Zingiber officinale]KAG6537227.1 hypothetical protein ZIOFF_002313 [Zingiber officinale]
MAKIHPNATPASNVSAESPGAEPPCGGDGRTAVELTVWRKSLLFNGNGFTVFDSEGNLVFRVDNYAVGSRNEILLMDADGKPLHTIRRKRLSLGDQWLIYNAEETINPQFTVKKNHARLLHSKTLAHATPCASGSNSRLGYNVEGTYSRRSCAFFDDERRQLAEIKRKESAQGVALGLDVFWLIIEPGLDASFAMAMVILLEQMFGSQRSLLDGWMLF